MSQAAQEAGSPGTSSLWSLGSSLLQSVRTGVTNAAAAQTAGRVPPAGSAAHGKSGQAAVGKDVHDATPAASHSAGSGREPEENKSALGSFLGFVSTAISTTVGVVPGVGGAASAPAPTAAPGAASGSAATAPAPPVARDTPSIEIPFFGKISVPAPVMQVVEHAQELLADPQVQKYLQEQAEQTQAAEAQKNESAKQIAANIFAEVGSVNANEYGMLNHMIGMDADMLARVKDQWTTLYPDEGGFDDFVRGQITSWSDGAEYVAEMEAALSGDPGRAAAYALKRSMAGAGTDMAVIEKTFASLSDEERKKAIATFDDGVGDGTSLQEWLDADLDGEDYQRMLALMNGDRAGERAVRLQYAESGHWLSLDAEDQKAQEDIIKECKSDEERHALMRRLGVVDDGEYVDEAQYQKHAEDLTKGIAAEGLPDFLKGFIDDETFAQYDRGAKKIAMNVLETSGDAATKAYVQSMKEQETNLFGINTDRAGGVSDQALNHDVLAGLAEGDEPAATAAMIERARRNDDPKAFGDALSALAPGWGDYSKLDDEDRKASDSSFQDKIGKVRDYFKDRYGAGQSDAYQKAIDQVAGVDEQISAEDRSSNKELARIEQIDKKGRTDRAFQAFYAMDGFGTYDSMLQDAFAGTSTAEAKDMNDQYGELAKKYSKTEGRSLKDDIADDTSGDLYNDVRLSAEYGDKPTSVKDQLAKSREHRKYDETGFFSGFVDMFSRQDNMLEKRDAQLASLEAKYDKAQTEEERSALAAQIGDVIDNQAIDRGGLRKDRDEISDRASTVAAAVATVASLGLGGVASAAIGGLSKMVSKGLLKGEAYSHGEIGLDAVTTGLQMATAGASDALGGSMVDSYKCWIGDSVLKKALISGVPGAGLGFLSNGVVGTAAGGLAQQGIEYDGSGYLAGLANAGLGTILNFTGNLVGAGIGGRYELNDAHRGLLSNTMGSVMQNGAGYQKVNPWGVFDLVTSIATDAASGYVGGRHEMAEKAKAAAASGGTPAAQPAPGTAGPAQPAPAPDPATLPRDTNPTLVDAPRDTNPTLVDQPAVDPAWAQATQKLPAGLSNVEQLKARGFTDEEMALYQGTLDKDAHGVQPEKGEDASKIDPATRDHRLNADGRVRPGMSDEEKQATLRAAFLLSEGLQEGADGRKVIPSREVGGLLNGATTGAGAVKDTTKLAGDVGFLAATKSLVPDAIARLLGLDYGVVKNGAFAPNSDFAEPTTSADGWQGAKVHSSLKQDGIHAIDYKYSKDMIDQMQIPMGAEMATYAKQVAAWFHADGLQAPWMLQLDPGGDPAAMQSAIEQGNWDQVKLANVVDRKRRHRFDPSTGKGYAAPYAYTAETGEPDGFAPNVEFTMRKKKTDANARDVSMAPGTELKRIAPDGKELVVAIFDGAKWVMNRGLGAADQQRYTGERDKAAADVAALQPNQAQ